MAVYTKICTKCGKDKNIIHYHSSGSRLKSRCKECTREDRVSNWHKSLYFDAKKRGSKPFDITPEYILQINKKQNGKCYWFGIDLKPSLNQKDPQMPTLDRLDVNKGYVKGNVVLACFVANMGRNETSIKRFRKFVKLLKGGV